MELLPGHWNEGDLDSILRFYHSIGLLFHWSNVNTLASIVIVSVSGFVNLIAKLTSTYLYWKYQVND